jgi:hypothetical protein
MKPWSYLFEPAALKGVAIAIIVGAALGTLIVVFAPGFLTAGP